MPLAHSNPQDTARTPAGPPGWPVSTTCTIAGPPRTLAAGRPAVPHRFHVLEKLGQGGMGVVHRAIDTLTGREIAIKSLNMPRPDDLYRLKREFRYLADVRHPNLIRLYELFANDPTCFFFTMELIQGTDFFSYAWKGVAVGNPRACRYERLRDVAQQLATGIAAVHQSGKLHRDIKPSNVLITEEGRVVLLDFGLAARLSTRSAKTKGAGGLIGTPGYIPPEQARGEALTRAADWYSFGVMLFEAITGQLPFDVPAPALALGFPVEAGRHVHRLAPAAPDDLNDLIGKLLHPVAECRPTGDEVLDRLAALPGRAQPKSVARTKAIGATNRSVRGHSRATATLRQALDVVKNGRPAVVRLARSRETKSDLGRQFADDARSVGALLLRGRCHLGERIAFHAWDGVVDDLSHAILHLPYDDARSQSMRELLTKMANRRPLVLWIDDAQRADRQIRQLLADMLPPPDAPAVLLVLCRDGAAAQRQASMFSFPARGSLCG